MTYFNGDLGVSVRYPATWRTEQAAQEGMWYRYFLGPPSGPDRKPSVAVTLLGGPLTGSLEEFAETYLAEHTVTASRDDARQGARGKAYRFSSRDGATRHSLLLLREEGRIYGLYTQGESAAFTSRLALIEEMEGSLTLERAADYPRYKNDKAGFALRVPPSWRETRRFSGGESFLLQYASPPLLAEKGQTVNASLTISVERAPGSGGLDAYYQATRDKLGESFPILSHGPWKDGYVDLMRAETPMATSRVKRYYRVAQGRGYSVTFEAREDAYSRVSRWCDMIAATLEVGEEIKGP